jgi:hypothetical protein
MRPVITTLLTKFAHVVQILSWSVFTLILVIRLGGGGADDTEAEKTAPNYSKMSLSETGLEWVAAVGDFWARPVTSVSCCVCFRTRNCVEEGVNLFCAGR